MGRPPLQAGTTTVTVSTKLTAEESQALTELAEAAGLKRGPALRAALVAHLATLATPTASGLKRQEATSPPRAAQERRNRAPVAPAPTDPIAAARAARAARRQRTGEGRCPHPITRRIGTYCAACQEELK